MGDGIFVLQNGQWVELGRTLFRSESDLQELLASHPKLIAGDQVDAEEPRRWLLVRREMGVPGELNAVDRWSIDHLLLDQDGIPTLVEVKKAENTEIRRQVVAQMLDYAANAVLYWPPDQVRSQFELRCRSLGIEPNDALSEHLGPEKNRDDFWAQVKTNLQAGRLRLLIVTDIVPPELRRIVEFLNSQMDPAEILVVEIGKYEHGELATLVPRAFGHVTRGEGRKTSLRREPRSWNETTFFEAVASTSNPVLRKRVEDVFSWAKSKYSTSWGRGTERGSFRIAPRGSSTNIAFFESNGVAYINMNALETLGAFSADHDREALVSALNAIPGMSIKPGTAQNMWLSFRLYELDEGALQQLLSKLDDEFARIS